MLNTYLQPAVIFLFALHYSAFHMYTEIRWEKYMFGCICFVPWSSGFHVRSLLLLSLPLREWLKICPPPWQNPSMPAQTRYVQRIGYPRRILKAPFISTIPNWSVNSWFDVSHSHFNSMKRIYTNVYMYDSNLSAKILQFAAHLDRECTCLGLLRASGLTITLIIIPEHCSGCTFMNVEIPYWARCHAHVP